MNEPQSFLNIPGNPNLECFYLVIQVRPNDLNNSFGQARDFLTWNSKLNSTLKLIWPQRDAENFQIILWFRDLSHPGWFVPYKY